MKKAISVFLILCFLCALSVPCFSAKEEPLITNGGFEDVSSSGALKGWATPPNVYSVTNQRFSGKQSLCIGGKGTYISVSQTLKNLLPTASYKLDLMLLAPKLGAFSPIFSFYNEKGSKFSSYQPFFDPVKTIPEGQWYEYSCTFTVPAHSSKVTIEFRANLENIYVDDICLTQISDMAYSEISSDEFFYYTDWEGGFVTINTAKEASQFKSSKLVFNIKNDENDVVFTKSFSPIPKTEVIEFKTHDLSPKYGERFVLESIIYEGPRPKGTAKQEIIYYDRPTHLNEKGQWVEDNGNVLNALTLNAGSANPLSINLAKEIGVNVLTIGHTRNVDILKSQLDAAWAEGLYCSVALFSNALPCSVYSSELKACVESIKDHPAIFSYAVQDEPAQLANPVELLKDAYRIIRDIDKNHPIYLIEASTATALYEADMKCVDILGIDPYPANISPYSTYVSKCVKYAEDLSRKHHNKPVYSVLQTFDWGNYLPITEEVRHMFYQSLMTKADGIAYFECSGILESKELTEGLASFSNSGEPEWAFNVYKNEKFDILASDTSETSDIWYTVYTDRKNVYVDILNRDHLDTEKAEIPVDFAKGTPQALFGDVTDCTGEINQNNEFCVSLRKGACVTYKFNYDKNVEAQTIPVHNYEDLEAYPWAKDAINRLDAKGFVNEKTDVTFEPATFITRGELALFLIRTLGIKHTPSTNFDDVTPYSDYAREVAIGKELGILNGIGDNKFAPKEPITRQDLMTIISRAMRLDSSFDLSSFPDANLVADYAKEHVCAMIGSGLIKGNADGTLNPLSYTTRAEAAVIMERIFVKQRG